jgi:aryl-alcohol dehydrogenase-like predicted oxidoreductase
MYGNGLSETNVGRVLRTLKPDIFLATKVTIRPDDVSDIAGAVARSLDESLKRLGRDHVDLLQLHNRIARTGDDRPIPGPTVVDAVLPAVADLKRQGKIRFAGITALGDTRELLSVIDPGVFDTAQIVFNLLNPSAGAAMPSALPGQDFARIAVRARDQGMGRIGIRVLAGGALSGSEDRHPLGVPVVPPIGSGRDYAADVEAARRFRPLVEAGHGASLVELALRFAVSDDTLSTVLVGTSTLAQLETAIAAIEKGALPAAAQDAVRRVWEGA